MNYKSLFPVSELPEDGLRFFHSLANWVERAKVTKPKLTAWGKGQKALRKLTCIKYSSHNAHEIPKDIPNNTLYVPKHSSGLYVLSQLRNAFCHNNLVFDKNNKQYQIELTDKVKIAGKFSLEAIEEFARVYITNAQ